MEMNKIRNIWFYRSRYHLNKFVPRLSNHYEFSTKQEVSDDVPIKYTASPAFKHRAILSRMNIATRLWYEPYVVLASLGAFLIYFGILREENDIDKELSRTLYERIDGLEEQQLRLCLEYNKEHGLPYSQIATRLSQLEKAKPNI